MNYIDYIDNCKYDIIRVYKDEKNEPLRKKNINTVVRKIIEMVFYIDKKYRKNVVIKVLNQMISDQYIDSKIDWIEYNYLIDTIDRLDIESLENEVYKKDEKCCYCL
jgi:hypothetical protein